MMRNSRTDLASEAAELCRAQSGVPDGLLVRRESVGGMPLLSVEIRAEEASRRLGKPLGRYHTLDIEAHVRRASPSFADASGAVAELIRRCGVPGKDDAVLVAALGNPDITPDALGPLCASSVLVTRHLRVSGGELWSGFAPVGLVRPGVLGTAGIESAEQIRAICAAVRPALVIVVDALAGADPSRLCRSIQVCDSGISPGSGVCNDRSRIDRALLGVPVTAIGVPTVADASALCEEGCAEGLFVTPRDIDSSVRDCARIIAYGINLALHEGLSVEEIDALVG